MTDNFDRLMDMYERLSADFIRTCDDNKRLRAALEYIAKGGLAYPEKHARAALEGSNG